MPSTLPEQPAKEPPSKSKNPVSQYNRSTQTDDQGNFEFDNVPFNHYHLTAAVAGFGTARQDQSVRSSVPTELKIGMKLGATTESVTGSEPPTWSKTNSATHTTVERATVPFVRDDQTRPMNAGSTELPPKVKPPRRRRQVSG